VTMRDNRFAFSGPIRAGVRVLRVTNEGSVTHEFRMVHVLPGHTGRESMTWTPANKTPRPDEDVTALVGIAPGGGLTTTVSLTQGEYVVFCVPQLARGMIQILRVGR
jgi:plastocyanin